MFGNVGSVSFPLPDRSMSHKPYIEILNNIAVSFETTIGFTCVPKHSLSHFLVYIVFLQPYMVCICHIDNKFFLPNMALWEGN